MFLYGQKSKLLQLDFSKNISPKYLRHLSYLGVQILVKRRRHRSSLFDNKERFSPEA